MVADLGFVGDFRESSALVSFSFLVGFGEFEEKLAVLLVTNFKNEFSFFLSNSILVSFSLFEEYVEDSLEATLFSLGFTNDPEEEEGSNSCVLLRENGESVSFTSFCWDAYLLLKDAYAEDLGEEGVSARGRRVEFSLKLPKFALEVDFFSKEGVDDFPLTV